MGVIVLTTLCCVLCDTQSWEALLRIVTSPTPFMYRHLLGSLVFFLVFAFPVCFVGLLGIVVIPTSLAVTLGLYGVLTLAQELENPLGRDENDIDLDGIQDILAMELHGLYKFKFGESMLLGEGFRSQRSIAGLESAPLRPKADARVAPAPALVVSPPPAVAPAPGPVAAPPVAAVPLPASMPLRPGRRTVTLHCTGAFCGLAAYCCGVLPPFTCNRCVVSGGCAGFITAGVSHTD